MRLDKTGLHHLFSAAAASDIDERNCRRRERRARAVPTSILSD